jgi:hypothetical protein
MSSAARPFASVSAFHVGDIGPGPHTGFWHRTPFHPDFRPCHLGRSNMQLQIGRDAPDRGASNAVYIAD